MDETSVIIALLGGLVLVLGLPSKWLEQTPIPTTLLALLIGVAVGPVALDWVDPARLAIRVRSWKTSRAWRSESVWWGWRCACRVSTRAGSCGRSPSWSAWGCR
jgi:hypothetical protein